MTLLYDEICRDKIVGIPLKDFIYDPMHAKIRLANKLISLLFRTVDGQDIAACTPMAQEIRRICLTFTVRKAPKGQNGVRVYPLSGKYI